MTLLRPRRYQVEALDAIDAHLETYNRIAVVLPTGFGKGHPLDTDVPTPLGLRKWGDLKVGDYVFGSNGLPTRVTAIYDRGELPTYMVAFKHGESVEVDGDHLWQVQRKGRKPEVVSTAELATRKLKDRDGYCWTTPVNGAVHHPTASLTVDPYTVGALIANGGMTHAGTMLTTPDPEVAARIAKNETINLVADTTPGVCPRYSLPGLTGPTRRLGLRVPSSEKRIPREYLQADIVQRIDLLHGLLDSDGSSRTGGRRSAHYHTTSRGLAFDVKELVTSLGGTCSIRLYNRTSEGKGEEFLCSILMPSSIPAFSSSRRDQGEQPRRTFEPRRPIIAIFKAGYKQIRCITVEAEDSLYCITRNHIVTHNTVVFSHLIARAAAVGKRALVLVHREELAEQARDKIHSVAPHLSIGIVKAERNEIDADVIIGSIQTLANPRRREPLIGNVGLVVVDECFPAGTLVGGRPIETIQVGDLVPSWDEETGREVLRPVTRVMKKQAQALVRVTFDDRSTIFCTPNHPFLTTEGWVPAGMLHGESVVSFMHHADAPNNILRTLLDQRRTHREEEDRLMEEIRSRLLQPRASGQVGEPGFLEEDGADEPSSRFNSDARAESDASRGDATEDVRVVASGSAPPSLTWWQRRARARAAAAAGRFPGLADRGDDRAEGRAAPVPLQGGHRASVDAGLRRGGRGIPFRAGAPSLRPEAGREVVTRRVVDVQVLEPGSDGTYGGVCAEGAVYNLEVEATHTYLIEDGIVVHNCHHAVARTWMEVLADLGCFTVGQEMDAPPEIGGATHRVFPASVPAVGFTATLDRTDGKGLADVWEVVAFEKDILYGIDNGYLTDVRGQAVTVDGLDLATIAKSRGDYQEGQLGDALEASGAGEVIARAYWDYAGVASTRPSDAAGAFDWVRQGVLFAPTVATAYSFAQSLRDVGISAETIEGSLSSEDRAVIYKRYREGEIRVLTNCMVLTEGWDAPWAEVAVIARPTQSAALYTQMVGRVLRPWPGKTEALVLDVVGVSGRHKLQSLTNLVFTEMREGESYAEARLRVEKEAKKKTKGGSAKVTGLVAAQQVELFANSHSVWLQTKAGTWFVPVGGGVFFLWPNDDGTHRLGFKRDAYQAKKLIQAGHDIPANGWIDERLTMEYAMARGEMLAEEIDPTISQKNRSWRRTKPSEKQVEFAIKLGVPVEEATEMRKGELSDRISMAVASRMLDPRS